MTRGVHKSPATARDLLDRAQSEAEHQKAVIEYLSKRGWLVNHNYDSRRSGPHKGIPDLICARAGRVLFVELKREAGRVTREQTQWIVNLSGAGIEIWIVRPSDRARFETATF